MNLKKILNKKLFQLLEQDIWASSLNASIDRLFFRKYGRREASWTLTDELDENEETLTDEQISEIITDIFHLYKYKWKHLFEVVKTLEDGEGYNPLWNYDKTSKITTNVERTPNLIQTDEHTGNDTDTRKDDLRQEQSHTGTDTDTREDNLKQRTYSLDGKNESVNTNSRNVFNSTDFIGTDKVTDVDKYDDTMENTGTQTNSSKYGSSMGTTNTGTQTNSTTYNSTNKVKTTGKDNTMTVTSERTFGNIGILTSGEALIKDVEAFKVYDFYSIVFKDVLSVISLHVAIDND